MATRSVDDVAARRDVVEPAREPSRSPRHQNRHSEPNGGLPGAHNRHSEPNGDARRQEVVKRNRLASAECVDQFLARLLTAAARFGANAAVLMPGGVAVALVAAGSADSGAGLQDGARDVGVVAGVPGQDARCGIAYICAVFVGANALAQRRELVVRFGQTRVSTRGARLRAGHAFLDAASQGVAIHPTRSVG